MPNIPSRKTSESEQLDIFDEIGSLDDYFKMLKDGNKELLKWKKEQEKAIVNAQKDAMKKAIKEVTDDEIELQKLGVKDLSEFKRKTLLNIQKEQAKKDKDALKEIFDLRSKFEKKFGTDKKLIDERAENKEIIKALNELEKSTGALTDEQKQMREQAKKDLTSGQKELAKKIGIEALGKALSNLTSAINNNIETYTRYQGGINARLQGLTLSWDKYAGPDKFSSIESRLTSAVGLIPFIKQEDILNNLQSLVEQGIASNVEQRAFLQTVKDDVATTFNAANSALLRIIRLQQKDSTAARMGMESYLTRFLNEMVSNTEYLNSTFDTVQEALLEASSQMSAQTSTEFEYIVQKWLGALTGVGLSEATAGNLAQAIGNLGSGNVEALSGSPLQNLLVMASSRAGLDYSKMLSGGLDAYTTNALMRSIVDYMMSINASGSNVVKSQYAKTFGLSISDLTAAGQLSESLDAISKNMLSFSGMYDELGYQLGELPERMGMSELISNVFANAQFSLATGIAKNPALAGLWKVTDMIEQATGGINISTIGAFGNFVDLNATVEQLMKLGVVGISSLGMIGDVISGVGNTISPASILTKLGIEEGNIGIVRGTGIAGRSSGMTTSLSTYVGNTSGGDIYQTTLGATQDETSRQAEVKQQEASEENPILDYLNTKLDDHLLKLLTKVDAINDKLSGTISVDISSEDIQGFSTGVRESLTSLLL